MGGVMGGIICGDMGGLIIKLGCISMYIYVFLGV